MSLRELIDTVLKTAFGTDAAVRLDSRTQTDVLADHAERKIDRMNAATERLANVYPAGNVEEALEQIINRI